MAKVNAADLLPEILACAQLKPGEEPLQAVVDGREQWVLFTNQRICQRGPQGDCVYPASQVERLCLGAPEDDGSCALFLVCQPSSLPPGVACFPDLYVGAVPPVNVPAPRVLSRMKLEAGEQLLFCFGNTAATDHRLITSGVFSSKSVAYRDVRTLLLICGNVRHTAGLPAIGELKVISAKTPEVYGCFPARAHGLVARLLSAHVAVEDHVPPRVAPSDVAALLCNVMAESRTRITQNLSRTYAMADSEVKLQAEGSFTVKLQRSDIQLWGTLCHLVFPAENHEVRIGEDGLHFGEMHFFRGGLGSAARGFHRGIDAVSFMATAAGSESVKLSIPWNDIVKFAFVPQADTRIENFPKEHLVNLETGLFFHFHNRSKGRQEWLQLEFPSAEGRQAFLQAAQRHNARVELLDIQRGISKAGESST